MLTRLKKLHARLSDQRGITLMETLVAMTTGIIVTGALFTILEFSLNQSTRISDVAQATQLGRTTMNRIVDTLHSACISAKFTPIKAGSNSNRLILVSGYSKSAEIPTTATLSEGVRKDEIEYSKTAGTIIDTYKLSTGVEASGEYRWATGVKVKLGEHITATNPFIYYKYAEASTAGTATSSVSTLKEIPAGTELTTTAAAEAAAVLVQFNIAPVDGKTTSGRSVDLDSLVTLAFTSPNSESTIKAGPCE